MSNTDTIVKKNHEILDDVMGTLESTPDLTDSQYHFAKMAMDEYEKQGSIGFAEWLVKSNFAFVNGLWFDVISGEPKKYVFTIKEVYDEYIEAVRAVNSSGGSTNSTSHQST